MSQCDLCPFIADCDLYRMDCIVDVCSRKKTMEESRSVDKQ